MRISDWSSDVCSSDLARGSAGVQYRNSLDYLIGQTSEVTTLAREGVSAQAYDRLLQGKARPGAVKLAQGVGFIDPTGGDVAGKAAGGGGGVEKAAGGRTKPDDARAIGRAAGRGRVGTYE